MMTMKSKVLFACLTIWLLCVSCEKDNIIPIYGLQEEGKEIGMGDSINQPPHWRVLYPYMYPYTMSAIVVIPDSLASVYKSADELSVFMDETCRGVAEHIDNEGVGYRWFVVIYGNEDMENLRFKYYSSAKSSFYESVDFVPFETNTRFGSVDNPKYISFQLLNEI